MPDLEMLLRDVRPAPDAASGPSSWTRGSPPAFPARAPRVEAVGAADAARRTSWRSAPAAPSRALVVVVVVVGADRPAAATTPSSAPRRAIGAPRRPARREKAGGRPRRLLGRRARPQRQHAARSPRTARSAAAPAHAHHARRPGRSRHRPRDPRRRRARRLRARPRRSTSGLAARRVADAQDPVGASSTTALAQLSRLAHVTPRSQQAEDLTDQRAALEAAVRDARADRDGLRARLAKAETEKERASLRAQLDRASQARHRRASATSPSSTARSPTPRSTLTIEGTRKAGAAAAAGDHWTPGDAMHDAGRVLEVIAGVLVIALAVAAAARRCRGVIALLSRGLVRRRARARTGAWPDVGRAW